MKLITIKVIGIVIDYEINIIRSLLF